jgi:hypothetical protein
MRFTEGVQRRWSELELAPDTHSAWDAPGIADHPDRPRTDDIRLTPDRIAHILDGDEKGGGHISGTGEPGKTEFPSTWDADTITAAVSHTAHRPQRVRQQADGSWKTRRDHGGVTVTAIVRPDGRVWTAWPEPGGPGVVTNPATRRDQP